MIFVAGQAGSGKTLVVDSVHAALAGRGGAPGRRPTRAPG
ncbi:hypothetical protein ABZW30_43880 [Kitasatospora sp. NPDC004669]